MRLRLWTLVNTVINLRLLKKATLVNGVHRIYESLPYIACFWSEAPLPYRVAFPDGSSLCSNHTASKSNSTMIYFLILNEILLTWFELLAARKRDR